MTTMKKFPLLGAALALACAAVPVALAQDASEPTQERTPTTAPLTATPRPFEELDRNADGAISKDEAAVDPPLAQAFGTLDKDADGRLSPEEYAVHAQGTP